MKRERSVVTLSERYKSIDFCHLTIFFRHRESIDEQKTGELAVFFKNL